MRTWRGGFAVLAAVPICAALVLFIRRTAQIFGSPADIEKEGVETVPKATPTNSYR
jgi:hypothetical protein